MNILITNIVLIVVEGIILCNSRIKQGKNIFLILAFIQLLVLHSFLDPFSMEDLPGYYDTFNEFGKNSLYYSIVIGYVGVKMEPGWIVFCKCLYFISTNFRILLIIDSILIIGGYLVMIKKYSPIFYVSVFVFLCTTFNQSLFVLRQHTAMAICLFSIPYIIKRDIKKFLVIITAAFLIHQTAIIFIPVYFVYNIRFSKKNWVIFLILLFFGNVAASRLFNWAFSHSWYNSYEDRDASNLTVFFIQLCCILLYLVSIRFKTLNIKSVEKVFLSMACLGLLLSFIGVGFSPTNRLVKYFSISDIWLIPFALKKYKTIGIILGIFVLVMYFLLFLAPSTADYIRNYRLIF